MADSTQPQGTETQPPDATEELRPERLGGQLRPERLGEPQKAERIQGMLAELPGWTTVEDGQAFTRTYLFPTIRASVAFVALAAEIGEANGYVPRERSSGELLLEETYRSFAGEAKAWASLSCDSAEVGTGSTDSGFWGESSGRIRAVYQAVFRRIAAASPSPLEPQGTRGRSAC